MTASGRRVLSIALFGAATGLVVWTFPLQVKAARSGELGGLDARTLGWSLLAYLVSHLLRLGRLAVLAGEVRFRVLTGLYWTTSAASFVLPFKLGDVYRVAELGWATGNLTRAVMVVWLERVFDALALLALVVAFAWRSDHFIPGLAPIGVMVALLVAVSVLVLKILPENMDRLNLHFLRAYRGRAAVARLRLLAGVRALTEQARGLLSARFATLLVLTICIWAVELLAVLVVAGEGQPFGAAATALVGKLGLALTAAPGVPSLDGRGLAALILAQTLLVQGIGVLWIAPYGRWKMAKET